MAIRRVLPLVLLALCAQHAHTLQAHKNFNKEPSKVPDQASSIRCLQMQQRTEHSQQTDELRDRMLDSTDGIINFDNDDFTTYVQGEERPYSLIIMATARHLMDKQQLGLRVLRKSFGLVGRALQHEALAQQKQGGGVFDKNPVFFVQLELGNAQQAFGRLGIQALPFVAHIPRSLAVPPDAPVPLSNEDKMDPNRYTNYPWKPDSFVEFVADATGYRINVPEPPSLFKSRYFPVVALAAIALGGAMAYQLYYAPFMRYRAMYMLGGLVIYWFSVSGGMYNIIRGMPMFVPRENGAQFFMQGSGQLGAEGFMMGATYTAFGVSFALLSLVAPRIQSTTWQRLLCYGCLGVAMFSLSGLLNVYKWKVGYNVHSYLFKQ